MNCPKDGYQMRTMSVHHATLSVCDTCGGVWFSADDMQHIARVLAEAIPSEAKQVTPALEANDILDEKRVNDPPYGEGIICPNDGATTERGIYSGDSKIVIDRCPTCDGVWFDGDELVRAADYLKPDARYYLGRLIVEEEMNTKKAKEELALLPLKLASYFSSPIGLVSLLLYMAFKRLNIHIDWELLNRKMQPPM